MKIEVDGLEKLERLSENLNKFAENDNFEVPVTEVFTNDFLQEYTDFSDLAELIDKSGCDNFDELMNNEELDKFIGSNSEFSSWGELFNKGIEVWVFNQIFEESNIDLEINLKL